MWFLPVYSKREPHQGTKAARPCCTIPSLDLLGLLGSEGQVRGLLPWYMESKVLPPSFFLLSLGRFTLYITNYTEVSLRPGRQEKQVSQ